MSDARATLLSLTLVQPGPVAYLKGAEGVVAPSQESVLLEIFNPCRKSDSNLSMFSFSMFRVKVS